jgi:hypothetical protein
MHHLLARCPSASRRFATVFLLLSLGAGLAACALPNPAGANKAKSEAAKEAKPAPAPKGTVLWVVRFSNEIEPQLPPTSLAVFVENQSRTHGGQFAFKAHQREPGQPSEFAVRLDLPPGTYRVTRMLGTAGEGATASQFEFNTQMQFAVVAREASYLGNLEVTNRARTDDKLPATAPRPAPGAGDAARFSQGTPFVTANNEVADDLVTLHTLWPDLRKRRIATRLPPRLVVIGPDNTIAGGVEARFPAPGAPSGEYVTGSPLAAEAGQDLPPVVQKAFTKFTRMKQPRAFAVGPGDAFGAVSAGQDVVARALAACNAKRDARGNATACRLYAVDDTLMSALVTRPPIKPAAQPPARTVRAAPPVAAGASGVNAAPPAPTSVPANGNTQPDKSAVARAEAAD